MRTLRTHHRAGTATSATEKAPTRAPRCLEVREPSHDSEDDRRQQEHSRVAREKQRPGEEQHACEPRRDARFEAPTAPDGEREQPHEDRAEERFRPDEGSVAKGRVGSGGGKSDDDRDRP